jgi:hypothetical protein
MNLSQILIPRSVPISFRKSRITDFPPLLELCEHLPQGTVLRQPPARVLKNCVVQLDLDEVEKVKPKFESNESYQKEFNFSNVQE